MAKKKESKRAKQIVALDGIELMRFGCALDTESDRGFVIMSGSMVERHLGALLKKHFLASSSFDDEEANKILVEGKQPMLQSLAIRATVAHAFGLIDRNLYDAIDFVREVRNRYAHEALVEPLTEQNVKPLLRLITNARGQPMTTYWSFRGHAPITQRTLFSSCVVTICDWLDEIAASIGKSKDQGLAKTVPSRPVSKRTQK